MEKVTFYSYKPYLHLPLHKDRGITVIFSGDCTYTARNIIELQLLREYAENNKASYNIVKAGGELGLEDFIRLHKELEDKIIADLEQRQAEKAKAEEKRKQEHEFYSLLRMV